MLTLVLETAIGDVAICTGEVAHAYRLIDKGYRYVLAGIATGFAIISEIPLTGGSPPVVLAWQLMVEEGRDKGHEPPRYCRVHHHLTFGGCCP